MPFFVQFISVEFDKMQIPDWYKFALHQMIALGYMIYFRFVWRQSEFAFLCADFGWRTFYFVAVNIFYKLGFIGEDALRGLS